MRAHTDNVVGNRVDTAWNTGPGIGNPLNQQAFAPNPGLGAHKAVMQKVGNFLLFGFDEGNDGLGALQVGGLPVDFAANPIDLTVAPNNFLNNTNSGIFIGTGRFPNPHALDNFTMLGVIPEPSSIALAAVALAGFGLVGWRSRRRAV